MGLSFTDADQWYEAHTSAPLNRRYEILVETLDQTLSEDFIEESGLVTCLLEMLDKLSSRNLIEQILSLTDELRTKQSDLYKKEYHYFDSFLVKYYLYRGDKEKTVVSLAQFTQDPVHGIDYMITLLDYLRFYESTDIAVELCQKTYSPVMSSAELLPGSESDLGYLIFVDMVEKAYQHIRSGETVDWEILVREAEKYGYGGGQEHIEKIRGCLTGELEGGAVFIASFRKNREESVNTLIWAFLKYMLDQKDMAFICSNHIVDGVLEFLVEKKPQGKKSMSPGTYFSFSRSEFEPYLAREMGGFMSMQQAKAVGTLWGIVYLYDFLLSKEIITDSMHRNVIKTVDLLKKETIKAFSRSLWRYDFVHRWNPPDSMSGDDFVAESELFSQTIEDQNPLGDELPPEPIDMLNQMMDIDLSSDLKVPITPIKLPRTDKKPKGKKSGARKSSGARRPRKKKKKRKRKRKR